MTPRASRLARTGALLLLADALSSPIRSGADEAAWGLLQVGGQVVIMRHASTDAGVDNPSSFRLEDCATQRNLSEAGHAEARRIGEVFRARSIPVGRVLSSRWCRCLGGAFSLKTAQGVFRSITASHNIYLLPALETPPRT